MEMWTRPMDVWTQPANAWLRASSHFANSMVEANRATLAAFGLDGEEEESAESEEEWSFERTADSREDIEVGDRVRFTKRIDDDDVRAFAEISGDTNPLHLEDEFARETRFGRRIVHGTLLSGLISAALARMPGLTIYLSQDMRFTNPADIGRTLTAVVEVEEKLDDNRYRLSTSVFDEDDRTVVDGEAVILVDPTPE